MIWNIVKKEFYNNLLTANFIIGFILCLLLIPFTVYTGVKTYENRVSQYQKDLKRAAEVFEKTQVYGQLKPLCIQPVTPLSIFCKGITEQIGNNVQIRIDEKSTFAEDITTMHENPFLNSFMSLDFVNILCIILSLLGMFFSYNLFSNEKEKGTLKLFFSNSVSRSIFFTGKITGIYITIIPVLFICYIIVLLIIQFSPLVKLSENDYLRICVMFIFSIVYFSFFVCLGGYISSKTSSSARSLIINLFVWCFILFLLPNIISYAGKNFVKIPDYNAIKVNMSEIDQEFWERSNELQKKVKKEDLKSTGWNMCADWIFGPLQLYFTPRPTMQYERRLHELTAPTVLDYADKKWPLQESYLKDLYHQQRIIKYLSCLSPSEIFKHITASVCKTDMNAHIDFMEKTRIYRDQFFQYYKDKKIFSSFKYFSAQDENTFPENWEQANEMYNTWRIKANPGSTFDLTSFGYLDTSDIPKFNYKSQNIINGLANQVILLGVILFLCIILLWVTYISFLNYDVR